MAVIDRDLVRAINSGKCFALVGSGPSCELGVPSWKQLSEIIIGEIDHELKRNTVQECRRFLAQNKYPEIFSLAEQAIGQEAILEIINASLVGKNKQGKIYRYIASWPFACYLTTNFDNHLVTHLENIGISYTLRLNSQEDIRVLRADSKNLIFKIHGDISVPQDIVLTAKQYFKFKQSQDRQYWRDKILSILNMVDLVIIGYSASDPEFQDQLKRAKEIASPNHPIFMFVADVESDHKKINEYYQKYNIRIIPYNNSDGMHRELERLLQRYDAFIAKRGNPAIGLEPIDESSAILASSMYLFTQLRITDSTDVCIERTYASLILQILSQQPNMRNIDKNTLIELVGKKTFITCSLDPTAIRKAFEFLHKMGFVSLSADQKFVTLEPKGHEIILTIKAERDLIKEKFKNSCRMFLKREYSNMDDDSINSVINAMERGLVRAYEKRGIEIAKSIFSIEIIDISNATDILETINKESSSLIDNVKRSAFADLMIEVVLRPSEDLKEYLAVLSQGYFAYHALGLEPRCSQERLDIAKDKLWILDSSILLPILANDCINHKYAEDLLKKMQNMGFNCSTTERLFGEVYEHAKWAINNFQDVALDDPNFLQAAMAGPGYKQNLFLDGFLKWSLNQGSPSFSLYMKDCLGPDYKDNLNNSIRKNIEELNITFLEFADLATSSQELWPRRDDISAEIERLRKDYGTYRGQPQCIAEAEVVLFLEIKDGAFLSQSGILNKLLKAKKKIIWKPEVMYRFLSLFSSTPIENDLMYDCMIQDFFYAGFDIIDKSIISKYFGQFIRQARMKLDQEKDRYEKSLGHEAFTKLKDGFEKAPDEQKPFYSLQFAFYLVDKETQKRREAESRAEHAEEIKQLTEKERNEFNRLKIEKELRHKKAEKKRRKIESQSKRKKKKRKRK